MECDMTEDRGTAAHGKRAYRSPKRQQRAAESRRSILTAARDLFTQHGYAGTTLEAIAEAAGVSPKTVVARFSSKRGILAEILDPAGLDSRHTAALSQLRMATDPRQRLELVARLTREVYTDGVK